jgi:L-alanine-DL-glutamate epimerase-like enolase superfamily enzyme
VCAATPNFAVLETIPSEPWHDRVQREPLAFVEGHLELPTGPGLGVELDEEVIASRPFVPLEAQPHSYRDGAPL